MNSEGLLIYSLNLDGERQKRLRGFSSRALFQRHLRLHQSGCATGCRRGGGRGGDRGCWRRRGVARGCRSSS